MLFVVLRGRQCEVSAMFVVVGLCQPQMSLAWPSVQGQLLCEYSNEDSRDSCSPVDNNVPFSVALAACSPLTSAQLSSLGPCTLQDGSEISQRRRWNWTQSRCGTHILAMLAKVPAGFPTPASTRLCGSLPISPTKILGSRVS